MVTVAFVKHYRRADLTDDCVRSLMHELLPDRIRVLDGSGAYRSPLVSVTRMVPNSGLIASFNAAIRAEPLRADLWWCLNNDVVVERGCLTAMVEVFARDGRVGIAAPLSSDPSVGHHADGPLGALGEYAVVRHVDNHAWAFSQRLVDVVGLPDERFGGAGWGANLDYCYRARAAGFLVAVSLGSWVRHLGGAEFGVDPEYRRKAAEERDRTLREKYGDPRAVWR
jgi:GT2 family glycosyltransferase